MNQPAIQQQTTTTRRCKAAGWSVTACLKDHGEKRRTLSSCRMRTDPLTNPITYSYHADHLLHEITLPQDRQGQKVKTAFTYYENGQTYDGCSHSMMYAFSNLRHIG